MTPKEMEDRLNLALVELDHIETVTTLLWERMPCGAERSAERTVFNAIGIIRDATDRVREHVGEVSAGVVLTREEG